MLLGDIPVIAFLAGGEAQVKQEIKVEEAERREQKLWSLFLNTRDKRVKLEPVVEGIAPPIIGNEVKDGMVRDSSPLPCLMLCQSYGRLRILTRSSFSVKPDIMKYHEVSALVTLDIMKIRSSGSRLWATRAISWTWWTSCSMLPCASRKIGEFVNSDFMVFQLL